MNNGILNHKLRRYIKNITIFFQYQPLNEYLKAEKYILVTKNAYQTVTAIQICFNYFFTNIMDNYKYDLWLPCINNI